MAGTMHNFEHQRRDDTPSVSEPVLRFTWPPSLNILLLKFWSWLETLLVILVVPRRQDWPVFEEGTPKLQAHMNSHKRCTNQISGSGAEESHLGMFKPTNSGIDSHRDEVDLCCQRNRFSSVASPMVGTMVDGGR
ncbi:hypothetical protein U1Q18_026034 [Sarracenia purpurea var. burkii]